MGVMLIIGHHQPVKDGKRIRRYRFSVGGVTRAEIDALDRSEARAIYKKHHHTRRVTPSTVITDITE